MARDDAEQELALVCDDITEFSTRASRRVAFRATRALAICLGCSAIFGVGLVAAQPQGLSMALPRRVVSLDESPKYSVMQASTFVKYPGYTDDLQISGVVTIHNADTTVEDFNWVLSLKGSSAVTCTLLSTAPSNACDILITDGTSCDTDTGNPYFEGTSYPYGDINYAASANAMGYVASIGSKKNVATGVTGAQLNGKTLILTDGQGNRASCALIERSILSDLDNAQCFPGDAFANVEGHGAVPLSELSVGDRVLVERSGELTFEPLLGFLHSTKGSSRFLSIVHANGELRASANHLVFVSDGTSKLASELKVGDRVLALADEKSLELAPSVVLFVRVISGKTGMIAPLTMAGSIVVDGTVASAYATHSASLYIPHGALHALFFPARFLARVSFGVWDTGFSPQGDAADTMHPLASVYAQMLIPFAKHVLSL
eukprot:TRINITY_DN62868_c0_g1_i1.p1 TRINITY_DN62868_c0_g1~~TRINITY_DN62868_c0_g1_i1.p1  ORF type:complete len:433 (+),score=56.06 TRINITY_DN62868_c0_g1_i1:39-1337(+)